MCNPDSIPQPQDPPCALLGQVRGQTSSAAVHWHPLMTQLRIFGDLDRSCSPSCRAGAAWSSAHSCSGAFGGAGLPLLHLLCSKATAQLPFGAAVWCTLREAAGRVCGCALLCQGSCQRVLCSPPSAPAAKPAVTAPAPLHQEGW